ncbi:MAG: acylneuraminate cytidylyltransferase family protein [Acidobacteria bacterium]|nr:acylneuraminate cytidylyltransferase family protein [Acidobacteriota bacterium]
MIPARGGSKAIPRKNLALLGGRPLIAYTVDAARASTVLARVVVSTDDQDIAAAAKELGADVPFLRPSHLAGDETPMLDVLLDLVDALEQREAYRADILVLLQPTSPFRRAEQIDAAVDLLTRSGADSVVTVVPVPHQFSPESLMQLHDNRLLPYVSGPAQLRRQDKPRLFARNGPAIVAVRTQVLTEQRTLYGVDTRGLVMTREESLDIDDVFDLELAELMLNARSGGTAT